MKDLSKFENLAGSGCGMNLYGIAGALNELLARGFKPKRYAATSGSGVIFGAAACGIVGEELERTLLDLTPVALKLLDPRLQLQLPWSSSGLRSPLARSGLVRGKKLTDTLNDILGKKLGKSNPTFADVHTPLTIHVTNFTTNELMTFSTEKTPTAMLAPYIVDGCRIPMIFEARKVAGCAHVDGGVIKNFPVDVFGDKGEKTIGLFFKNEGLPPGSDVTVNYEARLISLLIWAKTMDDIEDAPLAEVIDLPAGSGFDFNMSEKTARELMVSARKRIATWLESA